MLVPSLCWGCGGVARRREPLCAGCRRLLRRLAPDPVVLSGVPVWAPVAYSGPARDLVRALKFRGAVRVADAMGAQIAANAPTALLGGAPGLGEAAPGGGAGVPAAPGGGAPARAGPCEAAAGGASRPALVPVPLHPRRLRRRGYNQAGLIADALSSRTGLDVADCLARSGSAETQVGRDRRERSAGPAGSVSGRAAAPARVLLVDDVVTTGATLAACAAALHAAGAVEVAAIAFARTIGR